MEHVITKIEEQSYISGVSRKKAYIKSKLELQTFNPAFKIAALKLEWNSDSSYVLSILSNWHLINSR
jgi:hypothetical protein